MLLRGLLVLVGLLAAARLAYHHAAEHPAVMQHFQALEPFHPEIFHQRMRDTAPQDVFFEGWYYKLVGPYTDDIIVVIPGLFVNKVNASSSEAFITVVHGTDVNYYRFPVDQFKAEAKASGFTVTVGDSVFTETSITLSIMPDEDDDVKNQNAVMGEITFEDMTPWTQRLLHPSTMGVLGWLTGLECYHAVLSMHHRLHGYISVGESLTDLEQGTGYLEKDHGSSFPSDWIWAQANHFALLKPPKRGKGPAGEGEVWAETEENVEEVRDEGPGAGDASGAISALYADHVHNHEQPVSLFLSIARVPLPLPEWALNLLDERDHSLPGFVAGFLFEKQLHIFAAYQVDTLDMSIEVSEKDEGKEVIHLNFVDAARTRHLSVELHKPVQINAAGKRKKDTECLKKAISQKNRERERLGGKLNPLEEAFLMDDINRRKAGLDAAADEKKSPEEEAAMKAAIEAGIAAEKANTPEAHLEKLYAKPVPVPAPIVASMYGPKEGRMQKYVKESLVGGRIEVKWSVLLSAAGYAGLTSKEKKAAEWKQQIVGAEAMYVRQIYRGIGKPAAMEVMGDVEWLMDENQRRNVEWSKNIAEWLLVPRNAVGTLAAAAITLLLAMLLSCLCGGYAAARKSKVAPAVSGKKEQ